MEAENLIRHTLKMLTSEDSQLLAREPYKAGLKALLKGIDSPISIMHGNRLYNGLDALVAVSQLSGAVALYDAAIVTFDTIRATLAAAGVDEATVREADRMLTNLDEAISAGLAKVSLDTWTEILGHTPDIDTDKPLFSGDTSEFDSLLEGLQ